jgi:membrane protease YdiL (CAAX protease family)
VAGACPIRLDDRTEQSSVLALRPQVAGLNRRMQHWLGVSLAGVVTERRFHGTTTPRYDLHTSTFLCLTDGWAGELLIEIAILCGFHLRFYPNQGADDGLLRILRRQCKCLAPSYRRTRGVTRRLRGLQTNRRDQADLCRNCASSEPDLPGHAGALKDSEDCLLNHYLGRLARWNSNPDSDLGQRTDPELLLENPVSSCMDPSSFEPRVSAHSGQDRLFAGTEALIGAVVVVGHNVFHVLPNEVPILILILWISLLIRKKPWRSIGLCKPASRKVTLAVAFASGALLQLKDFVTEPFAHWLWRQPEKTSSLLADLHQHSGSHAALSLAIVWTFAAFGEELAYRALLLRRTADALNGSRTGYVVGVVFSSVLFGFGHFFKGPAGVLDSTVSGLILAAAYMVTRRNLWAPIVAHGLSDTFAVAASYFAWF